MWNIKLFALKHILTFILGSLYHSLFKVPVVSLKKSIPYQFQDDMENEITLVYICKTKLYDWINWSFPH